MEGHHHHHEPEASLLMASLATRLAGAALGIALIWLCVWAVI
ncbi:MAG TPA: hypothetical protein PLA85_01915 [Micropepsaceae bacterium]|nr:hypothetical protein [Micropepsaceae bacterium]HRK70313.1 hypothetical protein [Micropepsaceae bacterium]